MITMKTKYALKAMYRLAVSPPGEPVLIADIAEREGIPKKFLELILSELKQHGFLKSRKGRGGGYQLARDPKSISLASLIRVIEGPIAPVPCLSRTAYERCEGCRDEETCAVRLGLYAAYQDWVKALEGTSLHDVLGRVDEAAGKLTLGTRYSIWVLL
jgi:Rrf2 family protein